MNEKRFLTKNVYNHNCQYGVMWKMSYKVTQILTDPQSWILAIFSLRFQDAQIRKLKAKNMTCLTAKK